MVEETPVFTLTIEDQHGGIADEYSFSEGEFLIGRSHSADIILPSDNVSRRHARLYTVDGRCYIEDLNSSNGVFVNGRRIHEVYQIQRAAQLKVGDYFLHIEGGAAESAEDKVHCRLIGRNLAVADQIFRVTRNVSLVGRGKDCSITIIDPSVSRIHGKVTVERSGAVTAEDLKSSNGTFVNDELIEVATLSHRDILRFGNVELLVELPDIGPTDGGSDTDEVSDFGVDTEFEAKPSRTGLWIVLGVVGTLLVLGGILFAIFGQQWLGGASKPELGPTAGETAEVEEDEVEDAKAELEAEIVYLTKEGMAQMDKRHWDRAIDTFEKVQDRDPLNEDALRALNQIKVWKKDQGSLKEAKILRKEKAYGRAVKLLRDIDTRSTYHEDAQAELTDLMKEKPSLMQQAEVLLSAKDCTAALKLYEQAQQLDPRDMAVASKIQDVKKLQGKRRKCKK